MNDSPADGRPDQSGLVRHLIIGFLLALFLYITFFSCDEFLRVRKGPWVVTFRTDPAGEPALVVNQKRLKIESLELAFPAVRLDRTNLAETLRFDQPTKTNVPFGSVIFMDTTYLPGTVTFHLFGHEIELLPRTLVLDRKEHPWASHVTIKLSPADRLFRTNSLQKVKETE